MSSVAAPMTDVEAFLAHLEGLGIAAETHFHPAVFTVEEAAVHTAHLPGGHTKNLFLEDKNGGFWLVTCLDQQIVKVNGLARLLKAPRFKFATADQFQAYLGVTPGSVTPLALINDQAGKVQVVFDRKMLDLPQLNFHPLRNTATTTMATADFLNFITSTGHQPLIVDLDETQTA
jgi:Ala-tRNA(Pro) deacylase